MGKKAVARLHQLVGVWGVILCVKVGITPLEFPIEFGSARDDAGGGEPGGG